MNVVEKISQVFPDWEVEGIIGKGSFGEVYKVTKEEYGQQNISAVKVISIPRTREEVEELKMQGMDDMSVSTYYQAVFNDLVNEIQVMSSLKGNTNIVSIEDYKIEETKPFGWNIYIRMEYLTDLKTYLKAHPMTEKDIVRLGMDICSALEYCEKANIVHRDIKPANIFVSPYGDFKLGDFGIAKSIERTTSVAMSQKGTKPFMAPELIRGESGIKANLLDVYSLGIVLYCCLNNNRYPFMPKYPEAISYSDAETAFVRRINGERIEEPQFGSKNLTDIVLCACSGDKLYRFMSAAAMKSALSQIYSTSNGTEIILDINNPVLPVENNDSPISQPGVVSNAYRNDNYALNNHSSNIYSNLNNQNGKNYSNNQGAGNYANISQSKGNYNNVPNKKSNKSLILIFLIIFCLVGVGVLIYVLLSGNKTSAKPETEPYNSTASVADTIDSVNPENILEALVPSDEEIGDVEEYVESEPSLNPIQTEAPTVKPTPMPTVKPTPVPTPKPTPKLKEIKLFKYFTAPKAQGFNGAGTIPATVNADSDCPISGIVFKANSDKVNDLSNGDVVKYYPKAKDGTDITEYLKSFGYELSGKSKKVEISGLKSLSGLISESDKSTIYYNVSNYIATYQIDYSSTEQFLSLDTCEYLYFTDGFTNRMYIVYKIGVNDYGRVWSFYFYFRCDLDGSYNIISSTSCLGNKNSYVSSYNYNVPTAGGWGEAATVAYNGGAYSGGTYTRGVNHYYVGYYTTYELETALKSANSGMTMYKEELYN